MSWNHGTYGFERYEEFVRALKAVEIPYAEEWKDESFVRGPDSLCGCHCRQFGEDDICPCCLGTCDHKQNLRIAEFKSGRGVMLVVEEYLAIKDNDCDGASQIAIAVYEKGQRPYLETEVRDA